MKTIIVNVIWGLLIAAGAVWATLLLAGRAV